MKNTSRVPVLDGQLFTWQGTTGSACESDLPPGYVSRVASDSADEGFYIRSHKTGARRLFVFSHPVRREGDVMSNVFVSSATSGEGRITVQIFND